MNINLEEGNSSSNKQMKCNNHIKHIHIINPNTREKKWELENRMACGF